MSDNTERLQHYTHRIRSESALAFVAILLALTLVMFNLAYSYLGLESKVNPLAAFVTPEMIRVFTMAELIIFAVAVAMSIRLLVLDHLANKLMKQPAA